MGDGRVVERVLEGDNRGHTYKDYQCYNLMSKKVKIGTN